MSFLFSLCCPKKEAFSSTAQKREPRITTPRHLPSGERKTTNNPVAMPTTSSSSNGGSGVPAGAGNGGVQSWNQVKVTKWLAEELRLPQYGDSFRSAGIDGAALAQLDDAKLTAMGVTKKLHRTKIITRVQQVMQGGVWLPPRRTKTAATVARAAVLLKQGMMKARKNKSKGKGSQLGQLTGSPKMTGEKSGPSTANPLAMKTAAGSENSQANPMGGPAGSVATADKNKNPLAATAVADDASADQH